MARKRTIEVSALNITMHHPHSPQAYVELLRRALHRRKVFRQGEVHALMLGSLTGTKDAVEKNELEGEVFRFVKVDESEPWFNTSTSRQATDDELDDLNIPANLRAHMQRIQFLFFPKQHQLWFVSQDGKSRLGPQRAEKFFQELLDEATLSQNGPQIDVTALPDKTALDEMLSIYRLGRIVMQFKRPNPDDASEVEKKIVRRMQQQNVATINEELVARKGESIKPDEQTRAEAKVAAKNGRVTVFGKDESGVPVEVSTVNKPLRLPVRIDPEVETPLTAVRQSQMNH